MIAARITSENPDEGIFFKMNTLDIFFSKIKVTIFFQASNPRQEQFMSLILSPTKMFGATFQCQPLEVYMNLLIPSLDIVLAGVTTGNKQEKILL